MESRVGLVCVERTCEIKEEVLGAQRDHPWRITSIHQTLESEGIPGRCVQVHPRPATIEELQTTHNKEYIDQVQKSSTVPVGRWTSDHESPFPVTKESLESAVMAAGSVTEVATLVAEGKLDAGACAVRPPGNHAEANARKGLSIVNHVAVAVKIVKERGVCRVLIVDWGVFHENGTQQIFWDDSQVLYISVHRYDGGESFPKGNEGNVDQVGVGKGLGYNINVPLPHGGFGDADCLAILEQIVMPVARHFNPDMVFISAGFDSASGDPVGGCNVTPYGFYTMTKQLMELAEGRVVLALEGGYSPVSTPICFLACMRALLREPLSSTIPSTGDPLEDTKLLIEEMRNVLKKHWPVLGAEQVMMRNVPPTPAPNLSAECPPLQFDIDDGLSVRAPMDEHELKKQLPLQALLMEEHDPDDPMEGQQESKTAFRADFSHVPEF